MSTVDIDKQDKYWQEQFRGILGDSNALDVSYGISYLVAQIAPLPQTRNEHDRQTRKINALAYAIDDYVATQKATLKAELLAKLPKQMPEAGNYGDATYGDGHNDCLTEITKIVNEL